MRNVGDEVAPHRFEAPDARQVLHHQQRAAGLAVRDGDNLDELAAGRQFHRFDLHLPQLLAFAPGFDKLVVPQGDRHSAAGQGRAFAEQFFGGRVSQLDASLGIRDQHAVGHLVEDGGQFGAFRFDAGKLQIKA